MLIFQLVFLTQQTAASFTCLCPLSEQQFNHSIVKENCGSMRFSWVDPQISSNSNTVQCNTAQHNTTQHNTTQCNTTQYNTTIQYNTMQCNAMQCNTIQYKICLANPICYLLFAICSCTSFVKYTLHTLAIACEHPS